MGTIIKVTKLPHLNSVVLKQSGGHFFISAPNSFIIDKDGLLEMIAAMVRVNFISEEDLKEIICEPKKQ